MHTSKVQNFLEDRLGSHLRPDFRGAWSIGVHAHFHTTDLRPDFSDVVGGREEEHGFVSLLTNKSPALQTRNTMAMADAATTFTLQRQLFSHTTLHSSKSVSSAFSFSSSQLPPSRLCCNFWTALSNRSHHHCMQSFGCIASDVSSQQNSFAASAKLVVQVCESRSCSDSRFRAGFFLPVANLQSDKSFSSVILRKQRRTLTAVSSFGTLLQLLDRLSTCQPRIASSRFLARAQQEGKIVETEPEVETGRKLEKEAAAAVTAGIVAQDGSAAIQAAIAAADSAVVLQKIAEEDGFRHSYITEALREIYATCRQWLWKGYSINYAVQGSGPPILLVHGFGASIGHWRRNIGVLAKSNTVYAIDLLGLGASEKPSKFQYTMEIWAELLVDFIKEVVGAPTILIGNSIGSLACVIASAGAAPSGLVRGTVLLNCSGGMNNKAITDDWRLQLASPLLWLIDFLLQRPYIATRLFNRVKSRDNLKTILQSIYSNKDAVDDELVEVILRPADTAGALDAFVSIITGPPGPKPMKLIPSISNPILVLWGDEDPFTPINGPVGKYFQALPQINPKVQLYLLQGVGHCPHDDSPDLVHEKLLPWLANL